MKNKIILSIFLLTSFSLMNLYSRALRHIDMKDVKEKHQEKIFEKKLKKVQEESEKQYIQSKMKRKKYDWRKELNEMMTTADVFYTTLPATGNVDLAYPDWNVSNNVNSSISGTTLVITNSGIEGPGGRSNGILASFDTSSYDTLVFDVSISGNTGFGLFDGQNSLLFTLTSGTFVVNVSQSTNKQLGFLSPALSSGTVTVSNLRFQRRTPMNVFVPLSSPEATSFIRADPNLSNLSPEERRKKLIEMLKASDEYVEKMLGPDFPGTGAVPPGEMGDTPGVEVSNFDISKMEKDYGQVAGSMNTPSSAIKFMQDLMKDGFAGNEVKTTVNGQRMTGRPAEIIKQIKLNFPGGV
jgi:hypothetical protein